MAASAPLLAVRGVSKRFGGHQALRAVDLDLLASEVHAVAGENGAGKSTLMAVLSGALRPDGGTLLWEGKAVSPGHVRAAQALGISMVHQEPQLVPSLSVEENIALGHLPLRGGPVPLLDRRTLRAQAERALAPLGAPITPAQRVGDLRMADRQLVAIARALHVGGRLIILDEPTSSLAPAEVDRLFDVLRRLRESGTSVVYISHRLEELRALADRITVLRDGQVVITAPLAGMSNDDLVRAMSGREATAPAEAASTGAGDDVLLEARGA